MKTAPLFIGFLFCMGSLVAQDEPSIDPDLYGSRKNAVFAAQDFLLSFTINYERLFPLGEKSTLGVRGGLGRDGGNKDNVAVAEALVMYGRTKHFFELGIGYQQPNLFSAIKDDNPALCIMVGYRFQAPGGFLLKVYPELIPDIYPTEDSWGTIPFLGFALGYVF